MNEIKINKQAKSITFIKNGIAFSQFGIAKEILDLVDNQQQKIDRLNNIIDTILDFSFFKEECPLNFGFYDKKEEKAQDVFYEDDYCEKNCNDIYKKCWLKYFNKLKELKENNK